MLNEGDCIIETTRMTMLVMTIIMRLAETTIFSKFITIQDSFHAVINYFSWIIYIFQMRRLVLRALKSIAVRTLCKLSDA